MLPTGSSSVAPKMLNPEFNRKLSNHDDSTQKNSVNQVSPNRSPESSPVVNSEDEIFDTLSLVNDGVQPQPIVDDESDFDFSDFEIVEYRNPLVTQQKILESMLRGALTVDEMTKNLQLIERAEIKVPYGFHKELRQTACFESYCEAARNVLERFEKGDDKEIRLTESQRELIDTASRWSDEINQLKQKYLGEDDTDEQSDLNSEITWNEESDRKFVDLDVASNSDPIEPNVHTDREDSIIEIE